MKIKFNNPPSLLRRPLNLRGDKGGQKMKGIFMVRAYRLPAGKGRECPGKVAAAIG